MSPTIYAYCLVGVASHEGYLKVGYTDRDAETRIREQLHTSAVPYRIVLKEPAMRPDGSCFTDRDVHAVLRRRGFFQLNEGEDRNEWYRCSARDVLGAIHEVRDGILTSENRTAAFRMRPEQVRAVQKTMAFFPPPSGRIRTGRLNFSGTPRCASARPLRPTSWPKRWGFPGCWC